MAGDGDEESSTGASSSRLVNSPMVATSAMAFGQAAASSITPSRAGVAVQPAQKVRSVVSAAGELREARRRQQRDRARDVVRGRKEHADGRGRAVGGQGRSLDVDGGASVRHVGATVAEFVDHIQDTCYEVGRYPLGHRAEVQSKSELYNAVAPMPSEESEKNRKEPPERIFPSRY